MEYFLNRQSSFVDGSDSEGDQHDSVPDQQDEFTEEDFVTEGEEQQNVDNVNMPENRDTDDEVIFSQPSRTRSSRRVDSSDDEETVENDTTVEMFE